MDTTTYAYLRKNLARTMDLYRDNRVLRAKIKNLERENEKLVNENEKLVNEKVMTPKLTDTNNKLQQKLIKIINELIVKCDECEKQCDFIKEYNKDFERYKINHEFSNDIEKIREVIEDKKKLLSECGSHEAQTMENFFNDLNFKNFSSLKYGLGVNVYKTSSSATSIYCEFDVLIKTHENALFGIEIKTSNVPIIKNKKKLRDQLERQYKILESMCENYPWSHVLYVNESKGKKLKKTQQKKTKLGRLLQKTHIVSSMNELYKLLYIFKEKCQIKDT